MTYSDFEARWKPSGGAERANYGLFLQDLCDLIGVPRPDPTTDNPAQDAYVLERAVAFSDGVGDAGLTGTKKSTKRIDLYKRGWRWWCSVCISNSTRPWPMLMAGRITYPKVKF